VFQRIDGGGSVRLDRALQDVSVQSDDPLLKTEVASVQEALFAEDEITDSIDPPSVINAVFTHIMPHICNPAVLMPAQRRLLLRRLEARISSHANTAPVVPGGLDTLRHEIASLDRLLHASSNIIGG